MLQLLLHLIFSLQLLRLQVATPLSLTTAASFLAGGPDALQQMQRSSVKESVKREKAICMQQRSCRTP
jgi:hypothetical protein